MCGVAKPRPGLLQAGRQSSRQAAVMVRKPWKADSKYK